MAGVLHLLPNALGPGPLEASLPATAIALAARIDYFVGENAKQTRAFLKRVDGLSKLSRPLQQIDIAELNVSTPADALLALLAPIEAGRDGALVSDAGCPAVADPGALLVRLAHRRGIAVRPLVGPSSILLALMASGLDGQHFAFNGYLPTDRDQRIDAIRSAERRSAAHRQTQIHIETPYRNDALFAALVATLGPATLLCIARDLTTESEWIRMRAVGDWKGEAVDLDRRPTVFLFLAGG